MTDGYRSSSIELLSDSFANQGECLMTSIASAPGLTKEAAVDCLQRIVVLKDQRKAIDDEIEVLEAMVRGELEADPAPIVDFERGLAASLVVRNKPASIDLVSVGRNDENGALLVEAARAGVLRAALTGLRPLRGRAMWADTLLRYEIPGGVRTELRIDRTS